MKPRVLLTAALSFAPLLLNAGEFKIGVHNFSLPEGFTVEKVAGPGLVDRPIVADFDHEGRLYVAESSGSNEKVTQQLVDKPHRVLRLTDSDADGIFDKSQVFADKMMFPEGAMWLEGSLYVSAPPIIWKLTDTDDDGVADKREEWLDAKTLTGCANDLHGPYLGLDGWVYWCKGAFAEQTHQTPGNGIFKTSAAHIFRRRPEGGPIEPVMTGGMDNPVDVTFTPEGERIFTTTFFQHPGGGRRDGLVHAIYGGVYGKEHYVIDDHKKTGDLMPVLAHLGPAAPSGLTRYESEIFGNEYRDNLFAALFNLHKVTRHILKPTGASYQTADSDFLVSDNPDFHPTDVIEDADGSLLVVDTGGWYKLCCPTSQLWKPDVLGAIYRIRRTGAPKLADPRGLKIDWANVSGNRLVDLLADERPAVTRRAVQQLRREKNIPPALQQVIHREGATERQKLNAIWAHSGSADSDAMSLAAYAALTSKSVRVRHAALHVLSVAISANVNRAIAAELVGDADQLLAERNPPQIRRAAAELLGRTKSEQAVPALLKAAARLQPGGGGLPARVEEHSIIYALIEVGSPKATRVGLQSSNVFAHRAALIALDQMASYALKSADVIPLLTSSNVVLRQTANWIVDHRKDWGGDLALHFEERLRKPDLSDRDLQQITDRLLALTASDEICSMIARLVADVKSDARTRNALLSVMSRSGLRETPSSWGDSLATLIKSGRTGPEVISAIASLRFKELPSELKSQLDTVAHDASLSASTRLQALSALGPNARLDSASFDFVRLQITTAASTDRRLAASILAKCSLTESQLSDLCASVQSAGPLELPQVLAAYEKGSSENVGTELLAALKASPALSSLNSDHVQRTFVKFPDTIKTQATQLASSLNLDLAEQSARVEELLPRLQGGDIRRGQAIFNSTRAACSTCHAIGYLGGDLGPDLTRIGQIRTERDLLEAILFPSASFVRSYEPLVVTTREDEQFSGVLRKDAPDEIILGTGPGAQVRLARADVTETRPGKVSIMPQGLGEQLSHAELADLLAFLKATKW